jgi:hypothetical protein
MSAAQVCAIFLGGVVGYWVVSALIDRVRKRAASEAHGELQAGSMPSEKANTTAPTSKLPPTESARNPSASRSVWEEMNGDRSRPD